MKIGNISKQQLKNPKNMHSIILKIFKTLIKGIDLCRKLLRLNGLLPYLLCAIFARVLLVNVEDGLFFTLKLFQQPGNFTMHDGIVFIGVLLLLVFVISVVLNRQRIGDYLIHEVNWGFGLVITIAALEFYLRYSLFSHSSEMVFLFSLRTAIYISLICFIVLHFRNIKLFETCDRLWKSLVSFLSARGTFILALLTLWMLANHLRHFAIFGMTMHGDTAGYLQTLQRPVIHVTFPTI